MDNPAYRVFAIAVALMVLLTHQKNITRLLSGNESKVPILKTATAVVRKGGMLTTIRTDHPKKTYLESPKNQSINQLV